VNAETAPTTEFATFAQAATSSTGVRRAPISEAFQRIMLLLIEVSMSKASPNQHNEQKGKQNEEPKRGSGAPPAHIDHINKVPQHQQATGEEKPKDEKTKK
jgi:hypothetical protein